MKKILKTAVLSLLLLCSLAAFIFLQLEVTKLKEIQKEGGWEFYSKSNSGGELEPPPSDDDANSLPDIAFLILLIKKGLEGMPVL